MRRGLLLSASLVAGFAVALMAAGIHSLFFVLLPLLAFLFGYLSSWRWGLLCGLVLLASNSAALALLWGGWQKASYIGQYIYAFILGGFSLSLIGLLAPSVRRGIRSGVAVLSFSITTVAVGLCSFAAVTHQGYYYQLAIESSEDLKDLELYLPIGSVSQEPYTEILRHPLREPRMELTEDYTASVVDTEYGPMLRVNVGSLKYERRPERPYTANLIFRQSRAPSPLMQLMPKFDIVSVETISWQSTFGPIRTAESRSVETFNVPAMIRSSQAAQFRLTMWNRTDRGSFVGFGYSMSDSYAENVRFEGITGGDWITMPVKATEVKNLRGTGD